jgi:uncharacterized protein YhbP (UPF0306 family)
MSVDVENIIREYLPSVIHLSLATVKGDKPWVCEVHYAFDEDLNLYFRSLASRRHSEEVAENANVAGNIVKQFQPGEPVLGVYFEGTAERLPAGEAQDKAFTCLRERFNLSDEIIAEATREDGHQFYKISVESWYVFGRLEGDRGQKYQLVWNAGAQAK